MINVLRFTEELEKVGFTVDQARKSVDTWMSLINENFATKSDMREFQLVNKAELREVQVELQNDMRNLRVDLEGQIKDLITDLEEQIKDLITDLEEQIKDLNSNLEKRIDSQTNKIVGILVTLLTLYTAFIALVNR